MRFYQLWQKILNEVIEEHEPVDLHDIFVRDIVNILRSTKNRKYIRQFMMYCIKDAFAALVRNNEELIDSLKDTPYLLDIYQTCFNLLERFLINPGSISKDNALNTSVNAGRYDDNRAIEAVGKALNSTVYYYFRANPTYAVNACCYVCSVFSAIYGHSARYQKEREYIAIARSFKFKDDERSRHHQMLGHITKDDVFNAAFDYIEENNLWDQLHLIMQDENGFYLNFPEWQLFPEAHAKTREELINNIINGNSPITQRFRDYIKQLYAEKIPAL